MKNVFVLTVCLFLSLRAWGLYSFPDDSYRGFSNRVLDFLKYQHIFPQEKLYLHLDKPYYAAGDRIFLKGYLVDASSHRCDALSNFIYVELIDRKNDIAIRQKIRRDSLGFFGNLEIPTDFTDGEYVLRAYTRWMCNFDSTFFYKRKIRIGNPMDNSIGSSLSYVDEGEFTRVTLHFFDDIKKALGNVKVKFLVSNGMDVVDKGSGITDVSGSLTFQIPSACTRSGQAYVQADFDDKVYEYNRLFYLPRGSDDFAVLFFPEGGNLLCGNLQQVAFKAQASSGYADSISGFVVDRSGNRVAELITEHDGMGSFYLTPVKGEKYTAVVTLSSGNQKRFDLPDVCNEGVNFSVTRVGNRMLYKINAVEWKGDSLFIVAHTRGSPVLVNYLGKEDMEGYMVADSIKEGITHFILTTPSGVPLSERLVFVKHPYLREGFEMHPDKQRYGKRDSVCLSFVKDGVPLQGDFSVSVTERSSVGLDVNADNILSNLLLSSDLTGYIHNPGYYFAENDSARERHLDLVMMTHGWRRFNVSNLNKCDTLDFRFYIERGQHISGVLKSMGGRPMNNGTIKVLRYIGNGDFMPSDLAGTDSLGRFVVDKLDYPYDKTFMIQGFSDKMKKNVQLFVDTEVYPSVSHNLPFDDVALFSGNVERYMESALENYYYEGGVKIFRLKEVVVTGKRKRVELSGLGSGPDRMMLQEDIMQEKNVKTAYDLLKVLHKYGKGFNSTDVGGRDRFGQIVLNFMPEVEIKVLSYYPYEPELLKQIPVENIVSFSSYGSSLVVQVVKQQLLTKATTDYTTFYSLGYTPYVEFYSPVYNTPELKSAAKPDVRTTLYWAPSVVPDSTGKTSVSFYTSDKPADYDVVVEGVGTDGTLYRWVERLKGE